MYLLSLVSKRIPCVLSRQSEEILSDAVVPETVEGAIPDINKSVATEDVYQDIAPVPANVPEPHVQNVPSAPEITSSVVPTSESTPIAPADGTYARQLITET